MEIAKSHESHRHFFKENYNFLNTFIAFLVVNSTTYDLKSCPRVFHFNLNNQIFRKLRRYRRKCFR